MPDWAHDLADLHLHSAPSLIPRHQDDAQAVTTHRALGFSTVVLKAHEGSTAERALTAGPGVYGGVVLNSPVGGANPQAVEVAARFGARVVWLPTISSRAHQDAAHTPELAVHQGLQLGTVDVTDDTGALTPAVLDVLDVVAEHDLLLAGGHLPVRETVLVFTEGRRRGVRRLLVNHPMMDFLGWNRDAAADLRRLDARLELGVLHDRHSAPERRSLSLTEQYPADLLVFGGDLGHADHPPPSPAVLAPWLIELQQRVGAARAAAIMTTQTREILLP